MWQGLVDLIHNWIPWFDGGLADVLIILIKGVALILPLIIMMAYMTYAERKVIGYMQLRIGPNRVGPIGLLQPFADVFKMMFKEIIFPSKATAKLLKLSESDLFKGVPVNINNSVAEGCVFVHTRQPRKR